LPKVASWTNCCSPTPLNMPPTAGRCAASPAVYWNRKSDRS